MQHTVSSVAAALALLLATARAQEQPDKPDPKAELAALIARADAAGNKPEGSAQMRPEVEAFAKKHAGTDIGLAARLWLLQQCWWLRTNNSSTAMNEAADKMVEEILAEYPDNDQLDKIGEYSYVFATEKKGPLFERLLKSKHKTVRASMLLRLGLTERANKDPEVKARGKERLETLLRDYALVPRGTTTYGALAGAHLHPHAAADLAVGKPAPEIVGVDTDGNPMKLSDYRGKVLVVDFWGFW